MAQLSINQAIILILFLIAAAFITAVFLSINNEVDAQQYTMRCKLSLAQVQVGEAITPDGLNTYQLDCPRRIIQHLDGKTTISIKQGFSDEPAGTYTYQTTQGTQEFTNPYTRIDDVLVSELASCWDMLSEGSVDPLNSNSFIFSETTCHICAQIRVQNERLITHRISEDLLQQEVPYQNGLTLEQYLYTNIMPAQSATCNQRTPFIPKDIVIGSGDTLYVVAYREGSEVESLAERVKDSTSCHALTVLKENELFQRCNLVVN